MNVVVVAAEDKIYWVQWWWLLVAWGVWGAGGLVWDGVRTLRENRARQRLVDPGRAAWPERYDPAFGAARPARLAITQQGAYGPADPPPSRRSTGFDWFKLLEVVGIVVSIVVGIIQITGH